MFSKRILFNSFLVVLAIGIGVGTIMAVKADEIDVTSCLPAELVDYYVDADNDGYGETGSDPVASCSKPNLYANNDLDCDDTNSLVHPRASEVCDTIDNNCNGEVNEGIATSTYYLDADLDGYGYASTSMSWCALPSGYAVNSNDCNDADSSINPAALEECDGIDNDCDGEIDGDECVTYSTYYRDADGDDFGDKNNFKEATTTPVGYVGNDDDCNDADGNINPSASEICNGIDDDCDGSIDEGLFKRYYHDGDGDNYGDPGDVKSACSKPDNYILNNEDCDDADPDINPGAAEVEDGVDNDCDGRIDEGYLNIYYRDSDDDGYGDSGNTKEASSTPDGYVNNDDDCNDNNKNINPDASETCNGIDDDCDGSIDEGLYKRYYYDYDNDSYGDPNNATSTCSGMPSDFVNNNTDCDDDNEDINPGMSEVCGDNIDNNCDGTINENCDGNDDDDDCDCDCDCDNDRDDEYRGCNPFGIFKNHGQYVSCWAHYTNWLKKKGDLCGKEKGKIMKEKAQTGNNWGEEVRDDLNYLKEEVDELREDVDNIAKSNNGKSKNNKSKKNKK